ncbi:UDP-N-acetylmuramoyl-L-alanyl-D-glutamate--2,6-diaminopimelate ligase [Calorimonas adulescens]|uniref:UDP-N-acetylmuramoyl-L-alanyl-D-glutamate--2,6-diaminopimelate ligase n=1 Tax=Calorimonas adulescens TaxID=2606906 RepID=A0A5D8QC28_9THEO|nr:UDP-N-acetylmuramoyl-L-alanyl-D-glutamate--2,6-diaminopimelate ligase [Calorimonas adulescens]TZE81947.1 UDP-N-acetylmuramoyl-L-alanyl-D-glutamate--2,6-diaminopimelate ligase [Calorimonas adulescens]
MLLSKMLDGLQYVGINNFRDMEIKRVMYDSRKVEDGDIFVCIKGFNTDGHMYIGQAIKKGAKAVVIDGNHEIRREDVPVIIVEDTRNALAYLSSKIYGFPSGNFCLIGVTGTNGKTTVTFLIKNILDYLGKKTGLIGTIKNIVGDEEIASEHTTPEAADLQKLFHDMTLKGIDYCVMEVSSHSLELKRVDYTDFNVGVLTNITQDHLDFHITMDNYVNAKAKLFERSSDYCILNADDKYIETIKSKCNHKAHICTYGIENGDIRVKINSLKIGQTNFDILIKGKRYNVNYRVPGRFSVYNAMAAFSTLYCLGFSPEDIVEGMENFNGVPGRFEVLNLPVGFKVVIDYAHTPDGLMNILNSINECEHSRIITVFGCGGNRDKTKRPLMGKIACELSDLVIITSDNPRNEDPMKIIDDIEAGILNKYNNYFKIENRKEAIKLALDMAKDNDIVLLAGKGHETYQILGDRTVPFDERLVVKDILGVK